MNNNLSEICKSLVNLTVACRKPFTQIALGVALALPLAATHAAVAPITVSGNKILFGGQPGSVSGNSMFWSNQGWGGEKFYNASLVSWLKTDFHSNLVRAAMGVNDAGGYLTDPAGNKARVKAVVDAAIANDMYVIIDFHSHVASDYQAQSIAFFQEMATTYGSKNNVIYELFNEPTSQSWTGNIKPYCTAVIQAIRAIDPDNLIICGTPTWSQDVDVASQSPITGYANIAYTLHFYAGSHGQFLRDKAQTALNNGIPLFVTEWGSVNADGSGAVAISETNAWVSFMKTNNLSNANWSVNDKAEGASLVVPGASATGGWVTSQLTASGANAKSIILGWPALTGTPTSAAASSVAASTVPASSRPASSVPASSAAVSSTAASGCGSANFNKTATKGVDFTAVVGDCIKYTNTTSTLQIGSWGGVASTYNITSGAQGVTNTGNGWTAVAGSGTLYVKVVSASKSFTVKFDNW